MKAVTSVTKQWADGNGMCYLQMCGLHTAEAHSRQALNLLSSSSLDDASRVPLE